MNHEEIENINGSNISNEIETVILNPPANKSPGPDGSSDEHYQTFREELTLILLKCFQKHCRGRNLTHPILWGYYNEVSPPTSQNGYHQNNNNNKTTNNKYWRGCREKWTLFYYWWDCKLIQPRWRRVWRVLEKTRNKTTIWHSNLTTGHMPWENHNWKRHTYPMLIIALFITSSTLM